MIANDATNITSTVAEPSKLRNPLQGKPRKLTRKEAKALRDDIKASPLLIGYLECQTSNGEYRLKVWCPVCHMWHLHFWGKDDGTRPQSRAPDCRGGAFYKNYYIRPFTQTELRAMGVGKLRPDQRLRLQQLGGGK